MKLLCAALILVFMCGCSSLSPNERYRAQNSKLINKRALPIQNTFLDEDQQSRHYSSAAYITGCTMRRVGMDSVADFVDLLSEAADSGIIIPADKMRTFETDCFKFKISGSITKDLNSGSIYLLVEF